MKCLFVTLVAALCSPPAAMAALSWDFEVPGPNGLPPAWTGYGFSVQNGALSNDNGTAFPNLGQAMTPAFRYTDVAGSGGGGALDGELAYGAFGEIFTITINALTCELRGGDNCQIELLRVDQNNAVVELLWSGAHSGSFTTTVDYPTIEASGTYAVRVTAYDFNDPTVRVSLSDLTISHAELLREDFNHNGKVDAADFVLWRNSLFNEGLPYLVGDADGNGFVNGADYQAWRAHFSGPAGGAGAAVTPRPESVPEPIGILTFIQLLLGRSLQRYRSRITCLSSLRALPAAGR